VDPGQLSAYYDNGARKINLAKKVESLATGRRRRRPEETCSDSLQVPCSFEDLTMLAIRRQA